MVVSSSGTTTAQNGRNYVQIRVAQPDLMPRSLGIHQTLLIKHAHSWDVRIGVGSRRLLIMSVDSLTADGQ